MKSSVAVRLPSARLEQLRRIANELSQKDGRTVSMAEVLEAMIQSRWHKMFPGQPSPDYEIKAAKNAVYIKHKRLGEHLFSPERATALSEGARQVARGHQTWCIVQDPEHPHFAAVRSIGRGFALAFDDKDPVGMTERMLLDFADWVKAAAEHAKKMAKS